jgi:2-hydroxy-3-oxopropionate reductase
MGKEKIGFIGLGIMGKPMAMNLLNAGYSLSVLEKNKAAGDFVKAGATSYATSKQLAEESDIVITMLPDSPDVENVVFGDEGVIDGIRKGSLFIDMSTIAPSVARKIYTSMIEKGVEALDAPVSGGEKGAEDGAVSIMAGGSKEGFQKALPLFEIMGKNSIHIGNAGAGQLAKACNQIVIGVTMQGVAEAFALARESGVNPEKVREALLGGYAQSRVLDESGKRMIERNFKPGFKIKLHRKDMNIALQTGKEFSVPLYGAAQSAAHMDAVIAQGNGDLDNCSVSLIYEQLSGSI